MLRASENKLVLELLETTLDKTNVKIRESPQQLKLDKINFNSLVEICSNEKLFLKFKQCEKKFKLFHTFN